MVSLEDRIREGIAQRLGQDYKDVTIVGWERDAQNWPCPVFAVPEDSRALLAELGLLDAADKGHLNHN